MPIEIISGGRKQQPESWGESIQRNVGRGIGQIAKIPGIIGDVTEASLALQERLGGRPASQYPLRPPTTEKIGNTLKSFESVIPGISSQPKGKVEEYADMIVRDVPFLLASGGLAGLPAGLARSAASNAAAKGAEAAGAGPLGQIAASFAGGTGFDLLKKKGFPTQVRNNARKVMDYNYNKAREHTKGISMPSKILKEELEQQTTNLGGPSGLDVDQEKKVLAQIARAEQSISGDRIDLSKAWDTKKHLNKLIRKERDKDVRDAYKGIVGSINRNIIQPAAQQHKSFGKFYLPAEDLYIGLDAPSKIRKVLEQHTNLESLIENPLAKLGLLGTGGTALYLKGLPGLGVAALGAGATAAGGLTAREITRWFDFFSKSSEAQKMLKDIGKAALEENINALPMYLTKFNDLANNYSQKHPVAGVEIISGGMKAS